MTTHERTREGLIRPVPGRLFAWAKLASWVELCLFAGLLVVWLAPGLEHPTFYFGMAHGIGFIALAVLVLVTVLRHEAPYILLGATLTPVGPVGSVAAIAWIERRNKEGRVREGGHAARPMAAAPELVGPSASQLPDLSTKNRGRGPR